MLELPNPSAVWTLRAYYGGGAVRHRADHRDSTATTAWKMVCGDENSPTCVDWHRDEKAKKRAQIFQVFRGS